MNSIEKTLLMNQFKILLKLCDGPYHENNREYYDLTNKINILESNDDRYINCYILGEELSEELKEEEEIIYDLDKLYHRIILSAEKLKVNIKDFRFYWFDIQSAFGYNKTLAEHYSMLDKKTFYFKGEKEPFISSSETIDKFIDKLFKLDIQFSKPDRFTKDQLDEFKKYLK